MVDIGGAERFARKEPERENKKKSTLSFNPVVLIPHGFLRPLVFGWFAFYADSCLICRKIIVTCDTSAV